MKTEYLREDTIEEKKQLILFCKLIENEIQKKENNIKFINALINNEFKIQYITKNLILKCIEDINKNIKELNFRKYNNEYIRKKIYEAINENEIKLNIFNIINKNVFK